MARDDREDARGAVRRHEGLSPRSAISPVETAEYVADMATQLCAMCERAGLHALSTIFFAANSEALRARARLLQARSSRK